VIHINFVKNHDRKILRKKCPDCKNNSFFLGFFQEWYGWDHTCLRCGRNWINSEWMALDFYRYARRDSIVSAKKRWKMGVTPGSN